MIKEIVKDQFILAQKSSPATRDDMFIVEDLLDTIKAHQDECVGMAANMIGYCKQVIVFLDDDEYKIMINPRMIHHSQQTFKTLESCLCHQNSHEVMRYHKIKVEYYDVNWKKKIKTYQGVSAQIIQHELDHIEGKLI